MLGAASVPELLIFIFAVLSAILYICIIILLIYYRNVEPFDKPFFGLFLSLGFADVAHATTSYCFTITKAWAWVNWAPAYYHPLFGWWARASSSVCGWYFGWSQYFGVVAIAVNRHSTILWDGQVWNSRKQRNWLIIQWTVPFLFVAPLFTQHYQVVTVENGNFTYLYASPPPSFYSIYVASTGLAAFIVVFCVAAVYCMIFVKLRDMVREFQEGDNIESLEMKFLAVGFVLFLLMGVLECFMIAYTVASAIGDTDLKAFFSKLLFLSSSFFSFSNPFLLMAASEATRNKLVETFKAIYHMGNHNNSVQQIS